MVDYDLDRLGAREFEHLIQALALRHLGTGIQVFGDGPDGGREAAFNGSLTFPPGHGAANWSGYGVIQAKHRRRPEGPARDADWLITQLQNEFAAWRRTDTGRGRRGRLPEYFLLATNVRLSAVANTGGLDKVSATLHRYSEELKLRGWFIWHADQISRLLDDSPNIRQTYAGFLTTGDILTSVGALLVGKADDTALRLRIHAAQELVAQQWVRLGESGFQDDSKLRLATVAVDLPATLSADEPAEVKVLRQVLALGDHTLRPAVRGDRPMASLILGGPGQGKSTLAQLICQVYRIALLDTELGGSLGPPLDKALETWRAGVAQLNLPTPSQRRWPIHIDLSKYADEIAGGEDISILRYVAGRITARGVSVTASELAAWLEKWPWLLVLDGLDEVPAVHTRVHLVTQITDFVTEASVRGADLLLVATTRPQGYQNELGDLMPQQLDLRSLRPQEALDYADRVLAARHAEDEDLAQDVRQRLASAADEDVTSRLMRSPLQVTIMASLLERRVRVPQTRHALFDAYYETIYNREVAKLGRLSQLLDTHRTDVHFIHERVGLLLQIQAEQDGRSDALLPQEELEHLVLARLDAEGQSGEKARVLARDLTKATTDRLVLLTPNQAGYVGFEIRSLQEYMAARAITSGDGPRVLERLRHIAPSAHWRNTWLLTAGRLFETQEHLRAELIELLRQIDAKDYVGIFVNPGARLALDLLDDDLGMTSPASRRSLVQHALTLTQQWPGPELPRLAKTLVRASSEDAQAQHLIIRALPENLGDGCWASSEDAQAQHLIIRALPENLGDGRAGLATGDLLAILSRETGPLGIMARRRIEQTPSADLTPADLSTAKSRVASVLAPSIDRNLLTDQTGAALENVLSVLAKHKVALGRGSHLVLGAAFSDTLAPTDVTTVDDALSNLDVAEALALAADGLPSDKTLGAVWVRQLLSRWLERRKVGENLLLTLDH